jgi:hypothetical protein
MHHVDVTATPSGKGWALRSAALPELHAEARSLAATEAVATAEVARILGVATTAVAVTVTSELPDEVRAQVAEHGARLLAVKEAEARSTRATADAAHALLALGLTRRDVANVLHISYLQVCLVVGDAAAVASPA